MNMNRPMQKEKDIAIDNILQRGLQKPVSMWSYLNDLFQTLGFRFIFWDTTSMLALSAITLALSILLQPFLPSGYKHAILFVCSPLSFMLIMSFAETIEYGSRLYQLRMTCKYTIRQVTAFRILCFSVIGVVFSTGITLYQSENLNEFLRLIPLSFCTFFLCSYICLFFIRRFMGKWIYAISTLIWIIFTTMPAFIFGERWEQFLSELPVMITLGIAIFSCVLSLNEVKKFLITDKREAAYAVG